MLFLHNFKYALKTMLKNKLSIIWTLIFPIALATFMYMAFGNLFEADEMFKAIPVAVVEQVENENFRQTLAALSDGSEDALLNVSYLTEAEAKVALQEKEVAGIIFVDDKIRIEVLESNYTNTVLKTVVEEYQKVETVIMDIAATNPQALQASIDKLTSDIVYYTEVKTTDGNQDMYTNYFYAIFAMSCLFASMGSMVKVQNLQANTSALGMRRSLSPNSKMITIAAEYAAMILVQFVIEVITLVYMTMIGVDFGNKYPAILGILFFGACIGVAFGVIVGVLPKISFGLKTGITIIVSMVCSVLADLVAHGLKNIIEHHAPIINRLNPAALISDSFYALNVYDTYDRYIKNMVSLGAMALVLLIISVLMLRRNKYASL